MAKKLSILTRKIALSALSALYANSGYTDETFKNLNEKDAHDKNQIDVSPYQKQNLELKLRLRPSANHDKWEFFAHRSHRSHSSHSSHRSHYSSRTNDTYTPSGGNSNGTSSGSTTTYPNTNSTYGTSTTANKLGSRALKLGMEGEDVTELIKLLIAKGYYKLPEGYTLKEKELFDIIVEDAIKKFQKDKGIAVDGSVGPTTLYHLKY